MPWNAPLSRPLRAGKDDEKLEIISDAIAFLTRNHHLQRSNVDLNRLLIALSLAAESGRAEDRAQATDQLENYLHLQLQASAA